ncbi:alpha/beta fold hydrolase [Methanobrevibacter sp.]|uniref:alpha/beta fold hydrolase n=1 Tax=Methanobrevibacter sp. TaxID=66852 RepID=UPI0038902D4F
MDNEIYYLKNEQHFFDEFEFKNGYIIKNAKVDYGVVGTPKYDEEGNIINAILFCHNFMEDYSSISNVSGFREEINVIKEDYFIISITSLGFPQSCSPSTSGLNKDFPNYGIEDLVNFQRQLLSEKFPNIKKLKGIIGHSMGGFTALGFSIYYPEYMESVVLLDSSFKSQGYKYVFSNLANRIIDQCSEYSQNMYDESISRMLILISQIHYLMSFSSDYLNELSNDEIDMSIERFADDILFLDIYDIKFCNDFIISFNLESELDKIKCKLLIISFNSTNYYIPKFDAIPLHESVEGSQYLSFNLIRDSDNKNELIKVIDEIRKFLESV